MLSLINLAWLKPSVRRVRLSFLPGLQVDFMDRDVAIGQVVEWSERSTRYPVVIFGPEGCGKSAFLRQAAEVLREFGYDVIYVDVAHMNFIAHTDVNEVVKKLVEVVSEVSGVAQIKLANLAINIIKELLSRWGRKRVAILVDEAFQAIGVEKAGLYVKSLLNLIEYPPSDYEKVVAIAATSEGLSRSEIGRHRWSIIMPMWNMPKEGFRQLYESIPGDKPPFEDVWRLTGGNPGMLSRLYTTGWSRDAVVAQLIREKGLDPGLHS
jgi:Archaeal ATPase.